MNELPRRLPLRRRSNSPAATETMTPNNEPIITITLALSGVNLLLAGAAKLPYEHCAAVLHEVQRQAGEQLRRQHAQHEQGRPSQPMDTSSEG